MIDAPLPDVARAPLDASLVAALAEELGVLPGDEPWRGAVLARAATLRAALRGGDGPAARAAAAALAGLGEGSTPAGDDYLVGVLHGLRLVARGGLAGPRAAAADEPGLPAALAAAAAPRTTTLSAAWLREAAAGLPSPRWAALLAALDAGDEPSVRVAARAVRRSGHTSGAFSLRGFLDTVAP